MPYGLRSRRTSPEMQAGKTCFTGKLHDIWAQVRDMVNMVGMFIGVRENRT